MMNLVTTSFIVFRFNSVDIILFKFFIRTLLLELSFVGGIVDYGSIFVQLGLNTPLVERRHLLLTLTQIIL